MTDEEPADAGAVETLDSILNGREAQAEPSGDKQAQPEQEEPSGEPPEENNESVPMSAFKGLEAKYKQTRDYTRDLEAKLEALMPKEEPPDPSEDPERYKAFVINQFKSEIVKKSAQRMRDSHEDYDELASEFLVMTLKDADLKAKAEDHPDPARFAYETAMEARKSRESQILSKYRDEIERDILAKLQAEVPKKVQAPKVPNVTKAPAAGSNSTTIVHEMSLEEALGKNRPF